MIYVWMDGRDKWLLMTPTFTVCGVLNKRQTQSGHIEYRMQAIEPVSYAVVDDGQYKIREAWKFPAGSVDDAKIQAEFRYRIWREAYYASFRV